MSEQNLFVSAFQAVFLLKILARLHILKVQNTEHTGSNSISKVQNSNSKQTKVLNFISRRTTISPELHFKADHCPELHFKADQFKSGIPFQGRPLSGTPFRGGPIQSERSGLNYFEGPKEADCGILKNSKWTEVLPDEKHNRTFGIKCYQTKNTTGLLELNVAG
ncbi:hypothetical protein RclHR1_07330001 [Rhizophagus clarus]|uniref:Uncharacterized protein n=1 Tax=Rhizophagus clarus TaxID=94130 RepID=A0A2Z6S2J2_9GLOM|nr:hypothetical protein RclHR1_07330001 [Rhizophagus clarus]